MDKGEFRSRIADQFSYRSDRSDIWRALNLILATDEYLNLGFSPWYLPHFFGSSQRRLATKIGQTVAQYGGRPQGTSLLDIGCGRGGPARQLVSQFGFTVTGIDLVPYNVAQATNRQASETDASFVVGDATQLPLKPESMHACTAIDSLVYLPERDQVWSSVADVLKPGGVFVISDLVRESDIDASDRRNVAAFAEAWDMPEIGTVPAYQTALTEAGFDITASSDISAHSVGRFRKWTMLFELLSADGLQAVWRRVLDSYGLDSSMVFHQIDMAHAALPSLKHILITATLSDG